LRTVAARVTRLSVARWDAIVVGAGVVGLSAATRLCEHGLRVLAVDRLFAAAGASGLGAGSVTVQRWKQTDVALVQRTQEILDEVSHSTSRVFRFHRVGRLTLVRAADAASLRQHGQVIQDMGIELEHMDADELRHRFPGMTTEDVGLASYTPGDGYVHPPALAWALAGLARASGVTVWEGARVDRLDVADGHVGGAMIGGELVAADRVVVACGAWSRDVLKASGLDLPLKAYRLQVLFASLEEPGPWPVVLDLIQGDLYTVPRNPGSMLAGGGNRPIAGPPEAQTREPDPHFLAEAHTGLRHRFRGAGVGPVMGGWAGVTDTTPDGNPLVGGYRDVTGLYVACGLAGYGIMRGPAVGEIVGDLAAEEEPRIDIAAYRADRYSDFFDFPVSFAEYNPFA
jgi:sarcosine oxidase subunit beta